MITEAEKFVGGYGNEDQPLRFKQMLEAQTGRKWYYLFAQEYGNWSSNGKGNLLLSRYPFTSTGRDILSWDRTVAAGVIAVNGRNISIMATHLDHESKTRRHVQAGEVITVASQYVGPHIIAGDFNAWPDQSSIDVMTAKYYDSWAVAEAGGDASSFSGNSPFGATKNGRIDYIFYSRANSSFLKVVKSQVPDTRDSRGVMPSDHRPVLTTFEVR
jgi:endonuclease/exonuclease/phosphatase family metal-dependent hydrolase